MTVVRQSRAQRDGLMGALVAGFILALVLGLARAQTTGGRFAVTLFAGVIVLILVAGWIRLILRPSVLEVTDTAITLVGASGERTTLSREWGSELTVVTVGGGRVNNRGLTITGSGTVLSLASFFSLSEVKRRCAEKGWTFSGDR
jgi:hypothetical protein